MTSPGGVFWETFHHFLVVCEVLLDGTHSQAKPYIFMFWSFLDPLSGSTFPGVARGVHFLPFLHDFP